MPHLSTLDGYHYTLMQPGDLILIGAPAGGFVVQARSQPIHP